MVYIVALKSPLIKATTPYLSIRSYSSIESGFAQGFTYPEDYVVHVYTTFDQGFHDINIVRAGVKKFDVDVILANV